MPVAARARAPACMSCGAEARAMVRGMGLMLDLAPASIARSSVIDNVREEERRSINRLASNSMKPSGCLVCGATPHNNTQCALRVLRWRPGPGRAGFGLERKSAMRPLL